MRNDSDIPIGCADIIAYESNERILLVDCDIGGANQKKIQELIKTRQHFDINNEHKELKIIPVLFTSSTVGDLKNNQVALVDGTIIENILEELVRGNRESARSKITERMW